MGKICTKCKVDKLVTEYYKHKNGKNGLNPVCKVCWKGENKVYEINNPRHKYRSERFQRKHLEMSQKMRIYDKKKYDTDPTFKLIKLTRSRIRAYLNGKMKDEATISMLGIDAKGYKKYMENLFTENMSWDNHGEWEIDHIHPVSKGGSFHYTNTQPLWKLDNRKKSNKLLQIT